MSEPQRDKLLFTPGPLTTSATVKQAMLRDLGSRDAAFIEMVRSIRSRLLGLANLSQADGWEAVPMQGSGTFGIESVIGSVIPPDGKLLVLINGAYGERIAKMARVLKIATTELRTDESTPPTAELVAEALSDDPAITTVAIVHCETTTGIINPVESIGRVVKSAGNRYIADAMSSFGAVPLDLEASGVDYLISSANKCIEGVPGFAFVLARRKALLETSGWARSLSLDLLAQWKGLEENGQFRFTPPTHALLAFSQALDELDAEGGVTGRAARYASNYETLLAGMRRLGFRQYLPPSLQGYIITSFYYPSHPNFNFETFYRKLGDHGMVIYPGKLTRADCFRIGNIGRLFEKDFNALLAAIEETLNDMEIPVPLDGVKQ